MRSQSTAEMFGILYLGGMIIKVGQEPMDVIGASVSAHRRRSHILLSPSWNQTKSHGSTITADAGAFASGQCLCSAENVETFGTLSLFTGVSAYA
jgi:hypothetical protein